MMEDDFSPKQFGKVPGLKEGHQFLRNRSISIYGHLLVQLFWMQFLDGSS